MRLFRIWVSLAVISAFVLTHGTSAQAADSKEVNNLLRKAQSLYFKGKAEEADGVLQNAEQMVKEVEEGDNNVEKSKVKIVALRA